MARIEASFQDYFKIPILLKAVGPTSFQSLQQFHNDLISNSTQLIIDQRYEPLDTEMLSKRPQYIHQILQFMMEDFQSEWSEYDVIYRCRFVVGLADYDLTEENNLEVYWQQFEKKQKEQGKLVVGLIIPSTKINVTFSMKTNFMIIPQTIPKQELWTCLQPWLYSILGKMQKKLCSLIRQLRVQENNFIVFNKLEEKPDPKTVKRRKKGRCLKLSADLCLTLHLVEQAYKSYEQAEEVLQKLDDYHWLLGCKQGRLACLTTEIDIQEIDKQELGEELARICFQLCEKIKISKFMIQNFFKILKLHLQNPQKFDQIVLTFLPSVTYLGNTEKFHIWIELAKLYQSASMNRKFNYYLFRSAQLAIKEKPEYALILFKQIKKSKEIASWSFLQSEIIKLILDYSKEAGDGTLQFQLINSYFPHMSDRDIQITISAMDFRNLPLTKVDRLEILEITRMELVESQIKPKPNRVSQGSPSPQKGFFMSWRKAETKSLFQVNEKIWFKLTIFNKMPFALRINVRFCFEDERSKFQMVHLEPKVHNNICLPISFPYISNSLKFHHIELGIWNFLYSEPPNKYPKVLLQIYEEYPQIVIDVPKPLMIEQTGLFSFSFRLKRNKRNLKLELIKLTISVYYTEEVGFQQTEFTIEDSFDQKDYLVVLEGEEKYFLDKKNLLIIKPFRIDKKYLKKFQFRIDAIREMESKYQFSLTQASQCKIINSVWCHLEQLSTHNYERFPALQNEKNMIQEEFIAKIKIQKASTNLTPYQIVCDDWKGLLSENTEILLTKNMMKINEQKQMFVELKWENLTKKQEQGVIHFEIGQNQLMLKSQKQVSFDIEGIQKNDKIHSGSKIHISYFIKGSNISHKFIIRSLRIKEQSNCLISGKTKVVAKGKSTKNSLKLQFWYEYEEKYMFGIHFEDGQTYWHPSVFQLVGESE